MTTKFILPDWKGKTVAVLGSGPSFTIALADTLRGYVTIAVNSVVTQTPWADAALALDGSIPAEYTGIKMVGVPDDTTDAMFVGSMCESVRLSQTHTVEIRNSGLAAIRIAAQCGASKILLLGFDPEVAPNDTYPHLTEGFAAVVASIRETGVIVEMCAPQVKKALDKRK